MKIVFEDKNIIVINKPAGLLVHPVKDEKDTLVDWLIENYPEIKNIGDDIKRPGIVHRLDKDTSGLMVIAKNQESFNWLKSQFSNRKIEKKYLALVHGMLKEKSGIIAKSISRSKKKKQTIAPLKDTKSAITRYKVIKEYENYSLIETRPETGRTHQIRIHLASIGHPIAGDDKYKFKRQEKLLNRQFLHAFYLKFELPNGNIKEFEIQLPEELKKILEKL